MTEIKLRPPLYCPECGLAFGKHRQRCKFYKPPAMPRRRKVKRDANT